MIYYLYKIKNNINDKIYIGVHQTKSINDGYMGSGKVIKSAIEKYGIENFSKIILEFFDNPESMYAREKEIVNTEFLLREDVYNLRRGGYGGFDHINRSGIAKFKGKHHTIETKVRLRDIAKDREVSIETRQKLSENNWSKKDPNAQRDHASRVSKDRQKNGKPEEEKKKISLTVSENHKQGVYDYTHLLGNTNNNGKRWIHKDSEQKMIDKMMPLPEGWKEKRK